MFWSLGGTTVVSAVATVSARSPVYSAIWFALALLTTAGLFLLQGAQFLSVATVIVYAGAILVTFLFVLMLAQPEGHSTYDRVSWSRMAPLFASIVGMLLVGGLTIVATNIKEDTVKSHFQTGKDIEENAVLHENHMAKLGGELFTRHLVSVEVVGTLLLVALVGAIAIVAQARQQREQQAERTDEAGGSADA